MVHRLLQWALRAAREMGSWPLSCMYVIGIKEELLKNGNEI